MEEIKLRAFDRPAGISALTCGIAFGIAAVIYAVIPALSGFLWCFYFGYGLTVATGANPKNFKRYIACFLCGAPTLPQSIYRSAMQNRPLRVLVRKLLAGQAA